LEERAADRLFALLPEPDAAYFRALWSEFETAATDDSRFARAMDRLQPILVHWAGDGLVWRERGTTIDDERQLLAVIEQFWPPLSPLATAIIEDALERGMLVQAT
jgi:putative hydrolase of HD superfamily